jgi:hypothetical protein
MALESHGLAKLPGFRYAREVDVDFFPEVILPLENKSHQENTM